MRLGVEVSRAEIQREELRERGEEAAEVPVFQVVALGVLVDRALDHVADLHAPAASASATRLTS